jgi:hypothetical protein
LASSSGVRWFFGLPFACLLFLFFISWGIDIMDGDVLLRSGRPLLEKAF